MNQVTNKKFLWWIFILLISFSCRNKKENTSKSSLTLEKTASETWETECFITSSGDLDLFYTKERLTLEGNSLIHKEIYYQSKDCHKRIKSQESTWAYQVLAENGREMKIKLEGEIKTLTFHNPLTLSSYQARNPEEKAKLDSPITLKASNSCEALYTTLEFDETNKSLKFYSLRGNQGEAFPAGFLPYKAFYQ